MYPGPLIGLARGPVPDLETTSLGIRYRTPRHFLLNNFWSTIILSLKKKQPEKQGILVVSAHTGLSCLIVGFDTRGSRQKHFGVRTCFP